MAKTLDELFDYLDRLEQRVALPELVVELSDLAIDGGVMTETRFEFAPNGHVKAVGSRDLEEGDVCGSQDDDLHQVSNLQAGDAELVTLHVYSPPLMWMGTYSILDTSRGQEPMLLEFCDAAGI